MTKAAATGFFLPTSPSGNAAATGSVPSIPMPEAVVSGFLRTNLSGNAAATRSLPSTPSTPMPL